MEFFKSIGLLSLGILKRLYYLIPSLFSDPFDVLERWFNVIYEPPQWMFWVLLVAGLCIAIILAYHELRMSTSGYKLVGETKRLLREIRAEALGLKNKQNMERAEAELWVGNTATFIECALGTPRKMDFLRVAEVECKTDWAKVDDIKRFLQVHSNFLGDLADGLQETDLEPKCNLKTLRSKRKSTLRKAGFQH